MRYQVLAALCCLFSAASTAQAAPASPRPTRPPTSADVRAVAKASARGSSASARTAANSNGRQAAIAAGVPINELFFLQNPSEAQQVPLVVPDEAAAHASKLDFDFSGKKPSSSILKPSSNSRVASTPFQPIGATTASLVTVSGGRFIKNGKVFYPSGTSWFNMFELGKYTEADIDDMLAVHWANGVRVIRVFAHNDGYGTSMPVTNPIQPTLGVFKEDALRRYDYAVAAAGKVGIHLVLTMTNYWPEYGGMQWYVDQVSSVPAKDRELFFTDAKARAGYQTWVRKITQRTNTVNGRKYNSDPTIMAWELCNECHTTDNYEINKGLVPGSLLYNWEVEMSRYFKATLNVKQLVSNGNEGYRARGKYDPYAQITYPYLNWMNTGLKGEDYNRNLYINTLDFATIHAYPSNFGLSNKTYAWINDIFIGERQALAKAAGKPLMLEEFGAPRNYVTPRDTMFQSLLRAAAAYNIQSTVVWEVWARFGDDSNYDFNYNQAGGPTSLREFAWQSSSRAAGGAAPFGKYNCSCTDNAPDKTFTCAQQKSFGQCCQSWMQAGDSANPFGFCQKTCQRCGCDGSTTAFCRSAVPPPPPAATPKPTVKAAPRPTTRLPASCARNYYRAPGGCRACNTAASPFATTVGNAACWPPFTPSTTATTCSYAGIGVYVRHPTIPNQRASCVYSSRDTNSLLLPVAPTASLPFLKASSYVLGSLRLDGLAVRRYSTGQVASQVTRIEKNTYLRVDFANTKTLGTKSGKSVLLRGVLDRGGSNLDWCFQASVKVC